MKTKAISICFLSLLAALIFTSCQNELNQMAPGKDPIIGQLAKKPAQEVLERDIFRDSKSISTYYANFSLRALKDQVRNQTLGSSAEVEVFPGKTISLNQVSLDEKEGVTLINSTPESDPFHFVQLAVNEEGALGFIRNGQRTFQFSPLGDGNVAIHEMDQTEMLGCGMAERPVSYRSLKLPSNKVGNGTYHFDLLVVLSSYYANAYCNSPGLMHLLEADIENNLNLNFYRYSQYGPGTGQITLDATLECLATPHPKSDDMKTDREWLANNASIANLRNTHSADLVTLLLPDGSYTVAGRGFINYDINNNGADSAFSCVLMSQALGNQSLAHEIGHNLGMLHDRGSGYANSPLCSHGYLIRRKSPVGWNDYVFNSIMSKAIDPATSNYYPRYNGYSYPDTTAYNGTPYSFGADCSLPTNGINGPANNYQQLWNAAPVATQWR